MGWHNGYPSHPFNKEWFIAVTKHGERVVLRALPEEYSYDFKTADETYFKKENIVRWMQFPDSNFTPYEEPEKPLTCGGGFDGPHHTADWVTNEGPAVRVESVEEMIEVCAGTNYDMKVAARRMAKKLLSLTPAQLDALRKERK